MQKQNCDEKQLTEWVIIKPVQNTKDKSKTVQKSAK